MSPFMLPMPSRPRRIYALKHSWTSSKRPAARPSTSNILILHYDDMGQGESARVTRNLARVSKFNFPGHLLTLLCSTRIWSGPSFEEIGHSS